MAKTHGPLLSVNASGSVGKINTYSHRKTGNQCRYQRKQKDSETAAQLNQRGLIAFLHFLWQDLSAAEKLSWAGFYPAENLPGYNAFIKKNTEQFSKKDYYFRTTSGTRFDKFLDLPNINLGYTASDFRPIKNHYSLFANASGTTNIKTFDTLTGKLKASLFNTNFLGSKPFGVYYGKKFYIVQDTKPISLSIFNLPNYTLEQNITFPGYTNLSFDYILAGNYLCFSFTNAPGGNIFINLDNLSDKGTFKITGFNGAPYQFLSDNTWLYSIGSTTAGQIARNKIGDFATGNLFTVPSLSAVIHSMAISKKWLYLTERTNPPIIHRLLLSDFSTHETFTLPAGTYTEFVGHFVGNSYFFTYVSGNWPLFEISETPFAFVGSRVVAVDIASTYNPNIFYNCLVTQTKTNPCIRKVYIP
jgi:hypothetical protein